MTLNDIGCLCSLFATMPLNVLILGPSGCRSKECASLSTDSQARSIPFLALLFYCCRDDYLTRWSTVLVPGRQTYIVGIGGSSVGAHLWLIATVASLSWRNDCVEEPQHASKYDVVRSMP
jgi:hypothetical protein